MHHPAPSVLALALLTALVGGACASPQETARAPAAGERVATVVTWNVNFGLAGDPQAIDALRKLDADVVLLQETTAEWDDALRAGLSDAYPFIETYPCCGAGGLSILSKRPMHVDILPPVSWFPAARVVVDTPIGEIEALAVHLRPPFSDSGSIVSGYVTTPSVRTKEIAAFARAHDGKQPALVVGDFNEDDGGAVHALTDAGYVDALPRFQPSTTTWRWPVLGTEIHGRLDHVLYRPENLATLDVHVVDAGRSDHLPIVAVLTRQGT